MIGESPHIPKCIPKLLPQTIFALFQDYYYEENYYHEDSNGEISIDDVSEKNYRWVVQLRDNTYTATGLPL